MALCTEMKFPNLTTAPGKYFQNGYRVYPSWLYFFSRPPLDVSLMYVEPDIPLIFFSDIFPSPQADDF